MAGRGLCAAIAAAVLSLSLAGCAASAGEAGGPVASDVQGPMSMADGQIDPAICAASGGFVDRRGRGQFETCVHPYADAGKACTDNQQCDGKCVAAPDDGPDGQVVGQCQADDALFGCYAEVVDRKLVRAICVD